MSGTPPSSENQPNPTLVSVTPGDGYLIVDFTTDPYSSNVMYSYLSIWDVTNITAATNLPLTEAEINDGLYKITGLQHGEQYAMQLSQRDNSGVYYHSNVLTAETIDAPDAPSISIGESNYPITVDYVSDERYKLSFYMSFNKTNAIGILFQLYSTTKNTMQHIQLTLSESDSLEPQKYTVNELVQDDYLCSCRGIYAGIEGQTSNVFTLEVGLLPNAPTIKQVISGKNEELVVNFETVQNLAYNVESVTVEYSTGDVWSHVTVLSNEFSASGLNTLAGTATIPNLVNGSIYQVRAYATNSNGSSGISNVLTGIPAQKPVINVVTVTKASKNGTVNAEWEADLGTPFNNSQVKYSYTVTKAGVSIKEGSTEDKFISLSLGNYVFAINELIVVEVTAYKMVPDYTSWLSPDLAVLDGADKKWFTSEPKNSSGFGVTEEPTMVNVISGNDASLQASFKIKINTANPVTSVVLQYTIESDTEWLQKSEIPVSVSTFDTSLPGYHTKAVQIPNLVNGTTYKVRAYATNTNGVESGISNELTGIPAIKPSVSNVVITKASNGAVNAKWDAEFLTSFNNSEEKYSYTVTKNGEPIDSGTTGYKFITLSNLPSFAINERIFVKVTAYKMVPDYTSWLSPDLAVLDGADKKWFTSVPVENFTGFGVTEAPTMDNVISGNDASLQASFSINRNIANPIDFIVLQHARVGDEVWTDTKIVPSPTDLVNGKYIMTLTIPNLVNKTAYKVRTYAINSVGDSSDYSNELTGIPAIKPSVTSVEVIKATESGLFHAKWIVDLKTYTNPSILYEYAIFNEDKSNVIHSDIIQNKEILLSGLTLPNRVVFVVTVFVEVEDAIHWRSPILTTLSANNASFPNMLRSDAYSSTIDITLNPPIPTSITHTVASTTQINFTVTTQSIANKMRPMSAKIEVFEDDDFQIPAGTFTSPYEETSSSTVVSVSSLSKSIRYYIKVYNYNESGISGHFLPETPYWTFSTPKDITNVSLTQGANKNIMDHTISWNAYNDTDFDVNSYTVKLYKVENNVTTEVFTKDDVGADKTSYLYKHTEESDKGLTFVASVSGNLTNVQYNTPDYTAIAYSPSDLLAIQPTITGVTFSGTNVSFTVDSNGSPLISLISVVLPSVSNTLEVETPFHMYDNELSGIDDVVMYHLDTEYSVDSNSGYVIVAVNEVGSSYITANMA